MGRASLEGLNREFIEETGLTPVPLRPLGVHSYSLTSEQRRFPGPPIQVLQVVYLVGADGVPTHEVDGSTVEARWFQMRELESLPVVELVKVALDFRVTHIRTREGAD